MIIEYITRQDGTPIAIFLLENDSQVEIEIKEGASKAEIGLAIMAALSEDTDEQAK